MLSAKIKNFSYTKCLKEDLAFLDFKDINDLPSKCVINFKDKSFALSKWVSPKRTRSYPYARVYDTFSVKANKVVSVIPIFKDEGARGDRDYLQWDSVSLMSLLNVYVIIAFYDKAEIHTKRGGKITNQRFNNQHIESRLDELCNYHQSALHWNLKELDLLQEVAINAKSAYKNIEKSLNIKLHDEAGVDTFIDKINQSKDSFMHFSRTKAEQAQNREALTLQPKEYIGIGKKKKITIENYLGGQYFFTIDDVLFCENTLYICESKHSKNSLLPSSDDIKDGLLKLMLYNNLDSIYGYEFFKIVLRLTSSVLQDSIQLPSNKLEPFLNKHPFSITQKELLKALNNEAKINRFEIWINYDKNVS